MVPKKQAWEHSWAHIAMGVVLRSLRWLFVEDAFAEAYEALSEVPAAEPFPGSLAVFANGAGVDQQRGVLYQPR